MSEGSATSIEINDALFCTHFKEVVCRFALLCAYRAILTHFISVHDLQL